MSEQETAYRLLRAALNGQEPHLGTNSLDTAHWWSLFRLLQRNHVAALCYEAAAASGAPREVIMPWLAECTKAADRYRYQHDVQDEIVGTMQHHGITTLVLKGTHTARLYPQPELREFGDLDLYFYDLHCEADRVASKTLGVEVRHDSHHHTKYNYRGVTVESHYDFLNIHYPPSNRRYEVLLKNWVPSPTFEVLFLIRHMACHFAASRITLRDLTDWYLTCQALREQVDWHQVQGILQQYRMDTFASALSAIIERHLGHTMPLPSTGRLDVDRMEHDLVYGDAVDESEADGLARLGWKLRRWRALGWKRHMVFGDSEWALLLASLTSHAEKPHSILHKQ